jgi:hypothetical protein
MNIHRNYLTRPIHKFKPDLPDPLLKQATMASVLINLLCQKNRRLEADKVLNYQ